jgi:homoserine kinase type II
MTPQDPRDSTAFKLCYTSCLRRRELTMLDTADSGPDPRCACWDRTMSDSRVPMLEMLWEAHDPHGALKERFGFGDALSAGHWVEATVREQWGIRVDCCERIVISDRNALAWVTTPSGRLLAKWSVVRERFPRLSQIARLTHWLDGKGLPVSAPVRSVDGRLQVEAGEVSMCIQQVVQGGLLNVDDAEQVQAAGAILARLHHALAGYPDADQVVPPRGRPKPLAARVTAWLDSASEHVPEAARDALRRLVADAPPDLPAMQLVHGDFRSSNVLCDGPRIAAVIDFEEARLDHCIDEVARSAVMLGTRFRDWGPVSAEVRTMFLSGYQSVRRLTPCEATWWEVLVLWYALALVPPGDDPTGWGPSALSHLAELAHRFANEAHTEATGRARR